MPSFSSAGAATGVGRCHLPALEFEEPLNFITCHRLSSPQSKEECFSERCRRFMGEFCSGNACRDSRTSHARSKTVYRRH